MVGAGVSGLTAALRLMQAGADVQLLEAGPRPGGRVHTVEAGEPFEAGAEELHVSDVHLRALCAELDVALEPQPAPRQVRTLVAGRCDPEPGPAFRALLAELRRLHAAPDAAADMLSVADWMRQAGASPLDLALAELLTTTAAPAVPAAQASLLGLALEPESARGLRITGGGQRLVGSLAGRLAGRITLRTGAVRLLPQPDAVVVETGGRPLLAARVVLAVPLWARGPGLMPVAGARYGVAVKSLLRFADPLPAGPDAVVSDGPLGYARALGPHTIVAFTGGRAAAGLIRLPAASRDRALAAAARAAFGARPAAICSLAWPRCTLAPAPGQLTAWGQTLREPRGRVHLAGSEASERPSLVEGAVRAGERAAREVLEAADEDHR